MDDNTNGPNRPREGSTRRHRFGGPARVLAFVAAVAAGSVGIVNAVDNAHDAMVQARFTNGAKTAVFTAQGEGLGEASKLFSIATQVADPLDEIAQEAGERSAAQTEQRSKLEEGCRGRQERAALTTTTLAGSFTAADELEALTQQRALALQLDEVCEASGH